MCASGAGRVYMAFNVNCPRHYLDPDSLATFYDLDRVSPVPQCPNSYLFLYFID